MTLSTLALLLAIGGAAPSAAVSTAPASASSASISIAWLPARVKRWAPQIHAAAARHGVDPDLVAIVLLCESGGEPNAKSPAGALGLMQVMPQTAAKLAHERGLPTPTSRALLRPRVNLDYAAYLLAQLVAELAPDDLDDDAVHLVAAAYNGGLARALAYVGGTPLSAETTRYAARVRDLWVARASTDPPAVP